LKPIPPPVRGFFSGQIQDVCRERQISEQTFHRWKREFGMLEVDQAKRFKELQKENGRLKRMLADELLGKELLKEALEKKVMSPGHKRQIVESLVIAGRCSGRAACRHFGLHRSTFSYEAKVPDTWLARLKAALRRLSNQHVEVGYAKITCFLKEEGWKVGTRMVQRLRRELGLAVPAKKNQAPSSGSLNRTADEGLAPQSCVDVVFCARHHGSRRHVAHAQ
jgi:hypothetical protein